MSLELKRKQLELSRVGIAREELELKIEEYRAEIQRLEKSIEIQKNKEAELSEVITKMKGE